MSTVNVLRRKETAGDGHKYRWLGDLARKRLTHNDVFIPSWADVRTFANPKMVFYFTVPSEKWSCILVRGSAMTTADVEAKRMVLDREALDPDHIAKELQRERNRLEASVRRGLVSEEEQIAQAACFGDPTSDRRGMGPYRVYTSNQFEVEQFASMLTEAGYLVIPVLPAYSYRDVEFPLDDVRFGGSFVHAETRTPCPWAPRTHVRKLYS